MKILVTGGAGFIGSELVRQLQATGEDVTWTSRQRTSSDKNVWSIDLLRDVPSAKDLSPFDTIVHLAWETTHGDFWTSPDNALWRASTVRLFENFQESGGRYFLGAGSCAEYNWTFENLEAGNQDHLRPTTFYGQEKLKCFRELETLSAKTRLGWGRLFFPYGPGEKPQRLIPQMIFACMGKQKFNLQNPDQALDFIYNKDVANLLSCAVRNSLSGAFNVGSGRTIKLREVANLISEYFDAPAAIELAAPGAKSPECFCADLNELSVLPDWQIEYGMERGLMEYLNKIRVG